MYTEKDLVCIAKRDNNNKRKYLVVNRRQGKHIPVSPTQALEMFGALADRVGAEYKGERLLVIGFAETATAIGSELAVRLGARYIQTTRENVKGAEYIFFTESHSHAEEQRLVSNELDRVMKDVDRVVFAEDEITTGNTIEKIACILAKRYGGLEFSAASVLNGMDDNALKKYAEKGIRLHYLVKTDHGVYTELAESFSGDGEYIKKNLQKADCCAKKINVSGYIDPRQLTDGEEYHKACENLWRQIAEMNLEFGKNILVIGTEECMYPALYVGRELEALGSVVKSHSTTRSPIETSREENYPFRKRYELASFYDPSRTTYIYDVSAYDSVLIITDSAENSNEGENSLINALLESGNSKIYLVRLTTAEK